MKSILIAFTALVLSTSVHAATDRVTMSFDTLSSSKTYNATNQWNYVQTAANVRQKVTIRATGMMSALNSSTEDVATDVPGQGGVQGHSKLSLENINGKTFVSVDMLIRSMDGIRLNAKVQYKAEARFKKGSWSDYQNGRKIQLELTREGEKKAAQATGQVLYASVRKAAVTLSREMAGVRVGKVKFDKPLTYSGKTVLSGDRHQLVAKGSQLKGQLSFSISY